MPEHLNKNVPTPTSYIQEVFISTFCRADYLAMADYSQWE